MGKGLANGDWRCLDGNVLILDEGWSNPKNILSKTVLSCSSSAKVVSAWRFKVEQRLGSRGKQCIALAFERRRLDLTVHEHPCCDLWVSEL